MPRLNVWLKEETAKLLNRARLVYIRITEDTKPPNDKIINSALVEYLNKNDK